MQLAEPARDGLRAELHARASAGMQERGAAGHDLRRARAHAERGEQRERVAFGVECVDGTAAGPMPAFAVSLRAAAAQRRRRDALVLIAVAEKNLPDLEQRDVLEAPARVALGGGGEAWDQARAHVGKIGRDRVGERERRRAAAEQFRVRLRNERPGDRLAQAERSERSLGEPRALLQRRQHRLGHALVEPRQRDGRHAVETDDANDLLDDIGLAVDVGPPIGDDDLAVRRPRSRVARGSLRPRRAGCPGPSAARPRNRGSRRSFSAWPDRRRRAVARVRRRRGPSRDASPTPPRARRNRGRRRARSDSARR